MQDIYNKLVPQGSRSLLRNNVLHSCPPQLREKVIEELQSFYHTPPWGSCAGMAAPQLGYPYNLFVACGEVFENVLRIVPVSRADKYVATEGCFSVPYEQHRVQRYRRIRVRYEEGFSKEYDGFKAQVIQHEFDHIRGKLINT